jgi:AraC family transcriptional regulator of adaptative response/methylated-DNA-[protein]-cysteine methyltransferase
MPQRIILHGTESRPAVIPAHGLALRYGKAPCPFGTCHVADSVFGICHISFSDDPGSQAPVDQIHRVWPEARVTVDHKHARWLADKIFAQGGAANHDRPLLVSGTPFQIAIWRALLSIPPGTTISYTGLAGKIGKPGATRAAASAVGANRIAWLIPCHRIIKSSGGTGRYRWGTARKAAMLALETAGPPANN